MDDLAFLHARIESYADYTNDDDRRMSDEQIRAYVGEALARVLERSAPSGDPGEVLARLLLRCQFADQTVVRALDTEELDGAELASIHAADRRLVELADRAATIAPSDFGAYFSEIDAALEARARIVLDGPGRPTVPPPR